jgi:hypothetical protein
MLGEGVCCTLMALSFDRVGSAVPFRAIDPLSQNWERGGESGDEPRGAGPQGRNEGYSLPGKIDFKRF